MDELFRRNRDKFEGRLQMKLNQSKEKTEMEQIETKVKRRQAVVPLDEDLCRSLTLEKPAWPFVQHPRPEGRSFLDWMDEHSKLIFSKLTEKALFLEQLCSLKSDEHEWNLFVFKWKLWMIFLDQNVEAVWTEICIHLSILVSI